MEAGHIQVHFKIGPHVLRVDRQTDYRHRVGDTLARVLHCLCCDVAARHVFLFLRPRGALAVSDQSLQSIEGDCELLLFQINPANIQAGQLLLSIKLLAKPHAAGEYRLLGTPNVDEHTIGILVRDGAIDDHTLLKFLERPLRRISDGLDAVCGFGFSSPLEDAGTPATPSCCLAPRGKYQRVGGMIHKAELWYYSKQKKKPYCCRALPALPAWVAPPSDNTGADKPLHRQSASQIGAPAHHHHQPS
mmetsp:Transcript_14141/g.38804  ORF Transcript_14141/g.38804 Transcript_14141/m.38804 type:complete len:247 (-) Transcript_14141:11-751(-)